MEHSQSTIKDQFKKKKNKESSWQSEKVYSRRGLKQERILWVWEKVELLSEENAGIRKKQRPVITKVSTTQPFSFQ